MFLTPGYHKPSGFGEQKNPRKTPNFDRERVNGDRSSVQIAIYRTERGIRESPGYLILGSK